MRHDPGFDVELRPEEIAALLGRKDAGLHPSPATDTQQGRILVTGAGGSIGVPLVRHLASLGRRVVALDRSEAGLFLLGLKLREDGVTNNVHVVLRDVADSSVRDLIAREKIDLVVHAAAHKHVGLTETEADEAFFNNVEKTRRILGMAADAAAGGFLLISTDKAVDPVSVMGRSKAAAEAAVMDFGDERLLRRVLRLPNVLGTAGSAAQVFRRALLRGDELLLRDVRAERLYLGPGEALRCLLTALDWHGTGRLIPSEPPAISTMELARRAHALWSPGTEFRWRDVGLGPGERLRERLVGEDESCIEGPQGLRQLEKVPCAETRKI